MGQMIINESNEQSKEVQELMFKGGFYWLSVGRIVQRLNSRSISTYNQGYFLNNDNTASILEAINLAETRNKEVITATKFLKDPTIIRGWKKPVLKKVVQVNFEDISLSEIESMLKSSESG